MDVLIWKKCKEVKSYPIRIAVFIILSILFALAFTNLSGLQTSIIVWAYPITICFISTFVLFNADDLAQAILYRAMGIRMRSLWVTNWFFVSILSFITAGLVLSTYGMIMSWELDWIMIMNYMLSLPVIVALSSLGTLHYRGNTKIEVSIASVFSVINLGMLSLPFILSIIPIDNSSIIIVAALSTIGFAISMMYFSSGDKDEIINNTELFAKLYDNKFLGDE